ncbi:hypothetical protein B0H13DRAFT_1908169 [Mycena leptocephala]|nr:hypothetical protein B0H13DRAFT_1908169 [Mycena leptocephala]
MGHEPTPPSCSAPPPRARDFSDCSHPAIDSTTTFSRWGHIQDRDTDRTRELVAVLGLPDHLWRSPCRRISRAPSKLTSLCYITDFPFPVAFPPQAMTSGLAEWLSEHEMKQAHIADPSSPFPIYHLLVLAPSTFMVFHAPSLPILSTPISQSHSPHSSHASALLVPALLSGSQSLRLCPPLLDWRLSFTANSSLPGVRVRISPSLSFLPTLPFLPLRPRNTLFNGRVAKQFALKECFVIPSPEVATYDIKPDISVPAVADKVASIVERKEQDFVMCAPPNMGDPETGAHTCTAVPLILVGREAAKLALVRDEEGKKNGKDGNRVDGNGEEEGALVCGYGARCTVPAETWEITGCCLFTKVLEEKK